MNRGVRTKRKERVVQVVVERSRLGALCLAEAYEQVVPIVRRAQPLESGRGTTAAGDQQAVTGGTS
jgi:hypothetical protein